MTKVTRNQRPKQCNFRIGYGFDVHRFVKGRDLFLGGVKIPYSLGLEGHSDADVLIHSICDALLGAVALRDIGYHFPDNSDEFKGIDSKILLKKTVGLVREQGYEIGNIDVTVCLQEPKLKGYIPQMQKTLAKILEIEESEVSVKATTTEKLGFVGRKEGISSSAVVLVYKPT
jgi:2-C-methyl-D-erythritol 2,4-cyclodiphosphate synthase